MGEIVNLRLVRKAKARDDKTRIADENRARHGRTKSEKQLDRVSAEKSAAFLDAHRRTSPLGGKVEPQSGAGGGDGASPDHPSGWKPRD